MNAYFRYIMYLSPSCIFTWKMETKIKNKQSSFFHLDEVATLLNMSRMLMESLLALKKVSRFCQADPALSAPFPSILSSLKQQVKIKGYRYLVFYLEGIPIFLWFVCKVITGNGTGHPGTYRIKCFVIRKGNMIYISVKTTLITKFSK